MVKHSFDSIMLNGPMAAVEDLPIKASTEHYHLSNVYVKAITSFTSTQRNHLEFKKGKKQQDNFYKTEKKHVSTFAFVVPGVTGSI